MEHIGEQIARIERNMKLNTVDPVALHGFTQVPNFILRDPDISIGAKTVYSLLLVFPTFAFPAKIGSLKTLVWGSPA